MKVVGKVWKFAVDDINTDQIHLSRYSHLPIEEQAMHCLETIDPEFAKNVQPGDIVVAGRNFGCGSARHAELDLITLGVSAVVAESIDRKFFRNAISSGLLVLACPNVLEVVEPRDTIEVDAAAGRVINLTRGVSVECQPLPQFFLDMVAMGGVKPYLKARVAAEAGAKQ